MNELWLWLDLEMTGLDSQDTILEIACVITTPDLKIITTKPFHKVIHHTKSALDRMSEWCIENHQKSGLTDAVLSSPDTITSAEKAFIEFIRDHSLATDTLYLAGNSIHTDRAFVKREMPGVESMLHYRMIDVTAISLFLKTMGIENYEKLGSHRACDDILESIEELRHYKKYIKQNDH